MLKRIFSLSFLVILVVVLAGCGAGGGQSALPGGGSASTTGTGSSAHALMWDAPTSNTDGSPITDLAGYKIYYGTVSGNYTASIDVGNTTSIPITTLSSSVPAPGVYYITVAAYDTAGNESVFSNEITQNF